MADRVVYGIKSLKFMPAVTTGENAGSFPDFSESLASLYDMKMIVPDSFNMNQEDPEKLDVEWEEVEDIAMSIQTRKGTRSFTVSTNDMSEEAFKYFLGWQKPTEGNDPNKDWEVEPVSFMLPPQAVELETKPVDKYPGIIRQWAKVEVVVKETGVVGKSGLSNLELTCTIMANLNKDNKQIPGSRRKQVVSA
ncbi:hypothetical protein [Odoribacter splanchnicus]|nr:hypothetical protein [Odoribacter splanchnicus]